LGGESRSIVGADRLEADATGLRAAGLKH